MFQMMTASFRAVALIADTLPFLKLTRWKKSLKGVESFRFPSHQSYPKGTLYDMVGMTQKLSFSKSIYIWLILLYLVLRVLWGVTLRGWKIGTSGDILGRYERDIMMPSIEVIIKIADVLGVSIDFLVGKTSLQLDQQTLRRLEDIDALNDTDKNYILNHMDMMIRDFKTKKAFS